MQEKQDERYKQFHYKTMVKLIVWIFYLFNWFNLNES